MHNGTYAHPVSNNQGGMLTSKSRLLKNCLKKPCVELVIAQVIVNLAVNVKSTIPNRNIRRLYGLSDSAVLLLYIQGKK